ncbi:hypothetical protein [Bacillus wiedmannii]|uniref:hypothetical protein n=1 Tax=Bacillus wiedmannii TaxID=1890302 RepID=UPI000BEF7118|nr:hypothetical protein [Bacillus wiedmannii]PEI67993.1 hypothetical protein CN905_28020 [Bacillus wiedmannii]PFZ59581.1 hypothetical protein COL76_22960 [Bacillus wiedmannii]PHB64253.1 hypothetical protein COE87_07475 [Bacillus wiedmannii]PHE04586.1 hypothetical protein COF56_12125 [Bacillus wiedmannii]PHG63706.1 hypothetical protein COI55_22175 [Bacillus wiedmannii]
MFKNVKKVLAGAAIMGCALTGAIVSNAAAGDTSDQGFTLSFQGNSSAWSYTRYKYDSSSVYVKLTSIADGDPTFSASVRDANNNQFSKTWYVGFGESDIGRGKYIPNKAYEDRGSGVGVKIWANGNQNASYYNWKAGGVWSPDSI